MNYTDEFIKISLVNLLGLSESQTEILMVQYKCNGEFDDLISLIESKEIV